MLNKGLDVDKSNFTKYDSLETNRDLERLFDVLMSFKDHNGFHPVFTSMCIMANPDFEKIRNSDYKEYHFESVEQSSLRLPHRERIMRLWRDGVENKIFEPQFHGREHLNVKKYMNALRQNDSGLQLAFDNESIGVSKCNGLPVSSHLAAFDIEIPSDTDNLKKIIKSGLQLFESTVGYKASYFIASNSPEPKQLEETLSGSGIRYLTRYKLHKYPLGNNKYQYEFNWLGKVNSFGQVILTRNAGFEPSELGNSDWVDICLKDIEIAFKWNKPAIISTHRVNYIGSIDNKNADSGLKALSLLIQKILNKWQDVEFMSAHNLGNLITNING
jgi:hypothetical protein